MKKKIKSKEIAQLSNAPRYEFPKYTTQLINLINRNAQGTRPSIVGQMSELIQQFPGKTVEKWIEWYDAEKPDAVDKATEKIYAMLLKMKEAMELIDKDLIKDWVKDLIYTKTFCGLKFQQAIIASVANELKKNYRLANVDEEAKGIDGFIGEKPVQIKSHSYKVEANLGEVIDAPIIYYTEKKNDTIEIEYNPAYFQ